MSFSINLEFSGGMELLFDKKKHIIADLAAAGFIQDQCTIGDLLVWIKDNLLKEKPSMFMQGDTVRPGILVLINDADWELEDGLKYKVKNGDNILFISTLHGG